MAGAIDSATATQNLTLFASFSVGVHTSLKFAEQNAIVILLSKYIVHKRASAAKRTRPYCKTYTKARANQRPHGSEAKHIPVEWVVTANA